LLLAGCAIEMVRSTMTDKASYSEISAKDGNVSSTQARVWVYAVGGAVSGRVLSGGTFAGITFNKSFHWLLDGTFYHIDLPAGSCLVTTTNTGYKRHEHLGDIRKEFGFEPGKEYFIRVQFRGGLGKLQFPFDLVDRAHALSEMEGRKHYTLGEKYGEIQIKDN